MMPTTERYCELVADFQTHGAAVGQIAGDAGRDGCRPQTRHGCDATNFRCALSRSRLGSANGEVALVDLIRD